jgi:hypothetical protein
VRFPPFGFNAAVVGLIVFALVWWGYVSLFIGSNIGGSERPLPHPPPQQMALEAESPLESDPSIAETQPDRHGDSTEQDSGGGGMGGILAGLLMLPFIGVGLLMIWGILWQILGRTRVRLATDRCSYRRSLLGLGRTRTTSLADTHVRWTDEPPPGGGQKSGRSGKPNASTKNAVRRMMLTLGDWETLIGAHLSRREQEWVFHEMRAWLKRYRRHEAQSQRS